MGKIEKRSFTEKETAEYLRVSPAFLRANRTNLREKNSKHGLPFVKLGRNIRYLKEDIDAWIQQHRVSSY